MSMPFLRRAGGGVGFQGIRYQSLYTVLVSPSKTKKKAQAHQFKSALPKLSPCHEEALLNRILVSCYPILDSFEAS